MNSIATKISKQIRHVIDILFFTLCFASSSLSAPVSDNRVFEALRTEIMTAIDPILNPTDSHWGRDPVLDDIGWGIDCVILEAEVRMAYNEVADAASDWNTCMRDLFGDGWCLEEGQRVGESVPAYRDAQDKCKLAGCDDCE